MTSGPPAVARPRASEPGEQEGRPREAAARITSFHREGADQRRELGSRDRPVAVLGDEARLPRRERDALLAGVVQALEQPRIAGAVDRHVAARAVALDAEAALLEAGGARQPVDGSARS